MVVTCDIGVAVACQHGGVYAASGGAGLGSQCGDGKFNNLKTNCKFHHKKDFNAQSPPQYRLPPPNTAAHLAISKFQICSKCFKMHFSPLVQCSNFDSLMQCLTHFGAVFNVLNCCFGAAFYALLCSV